MEKGLHKPILVQEAIEQVLNLALFAEVAVTTSSGSLF